MSEQDVKNKLAAASSTMLINPGLIDFHRMEGMIIPGEYEIMEGSALEEEVTNWVTASEKRYKKLLSSNTSLNNLTAVEQLALASMVGAEYALGYQRPYLTSGDITKASDYNTYHVSGLPVGPICTISDASLQSAMSKKIDSDIYYFYYDYILNDMFFFANYTKFLKAGSVSRQLFEDHSVVDKRAKINKQALYSWTYQ